MNKEELIKCLKEVIPTNIEVPIIKLHENSDHICLTISQMYEYVDVNFSLLEKISHIFNTKKLILVIRII